MDWGYVAGYFDGEGTVRFRVAPEKSRKNITELHFANTHRESPRENSGVYRSRVD